MCPDLLIDQADPCIEVMPGCSGDQHANDDDIPGDEAEKMSFKHVKSSLFVMTQRCIWPQAECKFPVGTKGGMDMGTKMGTKGKGQGAGSREQGARGKR